MLLQIMPNLFAWFLHGPVIQCFTHYKNPPVFYHFLCGQTTHTHLINRLTVAKWQNNEWWKHTFFICPAIVFIRVFVCTRTAGLTQSDVIPAVAQTSHFHLIKTRSRLFCLEQVDLFWCVNSKTGPLGFNIETAPSLHAHPNFAN